MLPAHSVLAANCFHFSRSHTHTHQTEKRAYTKSAHINLAEQAANTGIVNFVKKTNGENKKRICFLVFFRACVVSLKIKLESIAQTTAPIQSDFCLVRRMCRDSVARSDKAKKHRSRHTVER